MIACPDHTREVKHADFVALAEGMVRHMINGRPSRGLRVGVHQGAFTYLDLDLDIDGKGRCPTRQGVGKGINRCARIVAIGDAGDITVTEQFIAEWAETTGEFIREKFSPRPGKDPFEVVVKHGESLELRFYRPGKRVNRPWPKKIRGMRDAQHQLKQQLALIRSGFIYYAQALNVALAEESLDVRVSLFAPDAQAGAVLAPTQFRYHPQDHGANMGTTSYSIAATGTGPAGRAFATHAPSIWIQLPDPKRSLRSYAAALAPSGLSKADVKKFYRKARAFIAFPFGMDRRHPDGAVCVDIMEPLEQLSPAQVREIADFLYDRFAVTLSALWRLRGQL